MPAPENFAEPEAASSRRRAWFPDAALLPPLLVLVASAFLIIGMKLFYPSFGSFGQLTAILITAIFLVVASFGQGLVILLGGIDLSIGVVIGIGGMIVAGMTRGSDEAILPALAITLLACGGIGVINGIGIAIGKIPPFIMTLSSSITFFGVALGATSGGAQQAVAPALQAFMSDEYLGVPLPIYFMGAFVLLAIAFQNFSTIGRKLYALGSSPAAAAIVGLPSARITILVYGIAGLCAGVSGVLLAGYSASATLTMGDALLMPTIAAVVIGGARVTGGAGLYLGTLAGALFLSTLSTVITALSVSQGYRSIIQGAIIIIALLLQSGRLARRRR